MKAQAAVEYLLLIGFLLVMVIPLFLYASQSTSRNVKVTQADDAIRSLATAAREVYALGEGAKKAVWVTIPGSVQSISLSNKEITMTFLLEGTSTEVHYPIPGPMSGTVPTTRGTYHLTVEMLSNGTIAVSQ